MIHRLTAPAVSSEIKGVTELHAVDAAGVHPLLLAKGRETYEPYRSKGRPQELLTAANAILGFGQCSLAKYLMIVSARESSSIDIHDISAFLGFVLERIDLGRDLHFHTKTTMDTLDYSGTGLGEGSKLVIAVRGEPVRQLDECWPCEQLGGTPNGFKILHLDKARDSPGGKQLSLPGLR